MLGFNPPPIQGISTTGGFELYLQDRSGGTLESLSAAANKVVAGGDQRPELRGVPTTFTPPCRNTASTSTATRPRRWACRSTTIFDTMQSTFGSLYVNDFTLFGRTYRVSLSSEGEFRRSPDDLRHVFVRCRHRRDGAAQRAGQRRAHHRPRRGRPLQHLPGGQDHGQPGARASPPARRSPPSRRWSRKTLPADYTIGWTGSAYQESRTAGTGYQGFLFGLLMVFLILAAQYERWSLPLAVITAVPFARVRRHRRDLSARASRTTSTSRSASITLIGLAAKNAILIVEFAARAPSRGHGARSMRRSRRRGCASARSS